MPAVMEFNSFIESLIAAAVTRHGVSQNVILLSFGFDPSQYRAYIREKRTFSDQMLQGIADSRYIEMTYPELIAKKLSVIILRALSLRLQSTF